jgi:dTMP kinase
VSFIAFEGGEGAGKSTQLRLLAERLRMAGRTVVETREPGGTPQGEALRALLVEGEGDRWGAPAEALLMNAARAEHVARVVRPALARGEVVLCDRYAHSTLAYQGAASGLAREDLLALHRVATGDLWPDVVLWLDLPAEAGLARAASRGGAARFEGRGAAFHAAVREGFAAMAAEDPRIVRVDADQAVELVADAVWRAVAVVARPPSTSPLSVPQSLSQPRQ